MTDFPTSNRAVGEANGGFHHGGCAASSGGFVAGDSLAFTVLYADSLLCRFSWGCLSFQEKGTSFSHRGTGGINSNIIYFQAGEHQCRGAKPIAALPYRSEGCWM